MRISHRWIVINAILNDIAMINYADQKTPVRCRNAYFSLKSKTHSKFFWSRYLLSPVKIWECKSTFDIFKTTILLLQHNWKVPTTSKIHDQQNKTSKCRSAVSDKVTWHIHMTHTFEQQKFLHTCIYNHQIYILPEWYLWFLTFAKNIWYLKF